MKWPKVPLGIRIFLLYITFVILCGYIITRTVTSEIKPGVRQTMEETLVDMSSLIAVMVADDVRNGTLTQSRYPELLSYYSSLEAKASIWGLDKIPVNKRIYITNGSGSVILDSAGLDVCKDYSRWNDVYLTLRGKYGARSTKSNPLDDSSTVMYVASPIMNGEKIKYVYLKKNRYGLEEIAFRGYQDPQKLLDFIDEYADGNALFEKELSKKLSDFYGALNWSFPSESDKIVDQFFSF